jgi:5'-nucleotidase
VRVWSTALTADQVRTMHRADQAPEPEGLVTFGEVMFGVVHETGGFGAALTSGDVTGRELDALLESQWQENADGTVTFRPLSLSGNVSYHYHPDEPVGEKIAFGQVRIDGKPLEPNRSYRVATLSREFLTTEAMKGFDALVGARDLHRTSYSGPHALSGNFRTHSPLTPPAPDRVSPRG